MLARLPRETRGMPRDLPVWESVRKKELLYSGLGKSTYELKRNHLYLPEHMALQAEAGRENSL